MGVVSYKFFVFGTGIVPLMVGSSGLIFIVAMISLKLMYPWIVLGILNVFANRKAGMHVQVGLDQGICQGAILRDHTYVSNRDHNFFDRPVRTGYVL